MQNAPQAFCGAFYLSKSSPREAGYEVGQILAKSYYFTYHAIKKSHANKRQTKITGTMMR